MENLQSQDNDLKKQVQSPQPPPVLIIQANKTNQQQSPLTLIATVPPAPAANTTTVLTTSSLSEKLGQTAAKGWGKVQSDQYHRIADSFDRTSENVAVLVGHMVLEACYCMVTVHLYPFADYQQTYSDLTAVAPDLSMKLDYLDR
ncbi:hypothetical protein ACROYT_G015683 [Oculina patagonica]